MKDRIKFRIFSIFSIICLCIGATVKSFQNDTFYVIKLGEYIYQNGLDMMDHYCWVLKLSYTYPHWLYDVVIYYIYHFFGYVGIYFSTIFLFIILILVVYYVHLKLHKNEFLALFASLLSIFCLYGFASARAQLLSLILFFLEVYFIERLICSGKNKYIFFLVLDSLLVANIHGTAWLMYFILFLPFLGEKVICFVSHLKCFNGKKIHDKLLVDSIHHFKKVMVGFILSFCMGIFTPSKICYTYVFRIMMGDSQNYILEHFPLVMIQHPVFIAIILVIIMVLVFTDTKVYLRELFMIMGLGFMCFMSVRHLAFFYTIGVMYVSVMCVRALNFNHDKTLDTLGYIVVNNKILYCILILIVFMGSYFKFIENSRKGYILKEEYPVGAVSYIKDNLDYKNMNIYNSYNIGSYLLYNDIPVFVDSRCDLYLKEFNGMKYSIFDDDMNMYKDYEKKFVKYDVKYALVSKSDVMFLLLNKDNDYKVIYRDKYFVLFERLR